MFFVRVVVLGFVGSLTHSLTLCPMCFIACVTPRSGNSSLVYCFAVYCMFLFLWSLWSDRHRLFYVVFCVFVRPKQMWCFPLCVFSCCVLWLKWCVPLVVLWVCSDSSLVAGSGYRSCFFHSSTAATAIIHETILVFYLLCSLSLFLLGSFLFCFLCLLIIW